jgi:hypothetical protein
MKVEKEIKELDLAARTRKKLDVEAEKRKKLTSKHMTGPNMEERERVLEARMEARMKKSLAPPPPHTHAPTPSPKNKSPAKMKGAKAQKTWKDCIGAGEAAAEGGGHGSGKAPAATEWLHSSDDDACDEQHLQHLQHLKRKPASHIKPEAKAVPKGVANAVRGESSDALTPGQRPKPLTPHQRAKAL